MTLYETIPTRRLFISEDDLYTSEAIALAPLTGYYLFDDSDDPADWEREGYPYSCFAHEREEEVPGEGEDFDEDFDDDLDDEDFDDDLEDFDDEDFDEDDDFYEEEESGELEDEDEDEDEEDK